MATQLYLVGSDASQFHLVNSSGTPTPGGDPSDGATTPFGVRSSWALRNGKRLDTYVDDTIPLYYVGDDMDAAIAHLETLRTLMSDALSANNALVSQPHGALTALSYGVYVIDSVQWAPLANTEYSPSEGALTFLVDLTLRRTPFPGPTIYQTLP